jgi:hypothetical protein
VEIWGAGGALYEFCFLDFTGYHLYITFDCNMSEKTTRRMMDGIGVFCLFPFHCVVWFGGVDG